MFDRFNEDISLERRVINRNIDRFGESSVFSECSTSNRNVMFAQEGMMNDIRNGVNPRSRKLVFHVSDRGYLDGQVFKPRVPEYLDRYDPNYPNFEDVSKLFDHAAHNGSNYLIGHCFVSLMLCFEVE